MRPMALVLAVSVALALSLAACGGSDSTAGTTQAAKPVRMIKVLKVLHKPYEIKVPPKGPPPRGLVVKEMHRGYGPAVKSGDTVELEYLDADYKDKSGKLFYSTWNQGGFFKLKLGEGRPTPSWDKAVEGMRLGGRRELIMPSNLAVRAGEADPVIPPKAKTVVFIVDLYARS